MRSTLRGLVPLAAVALACTLGAPARSADADRQPAAADQKVYDMLRDIINEGADLYNTGDPAGCYRLYEGALKALRPLAHDTWQKAITDGLAEADRTPSVPEKAFALRRAIDRIRGDIHPRKSTAGTAGTPRPEETPIRPRPRPSRTEPTGATTLWERLGGKEGVTAVVDDFVAIAGKDRRVDFSRGGKYNLTDDAVAKLKRGLVAWVSLKTGGPIPYTGEDMKRLHKGMEITDAEFDASVEDLREALEKHGVKGADLDAVLGAVRATRRDIVEKTGGEKKEDRKPAGPKEEKKEEKKSSDKNKP